MDKIKIVTHDQEEFVVKVEDYNAKEIHEELNNHESNSIEIGGCIFASIDIKRIVPVYEDTPLAPLEPSIEEDNPTHPIDPIIPDEEIPWTPLEPSEELDKPATLPEFEDGIAEVE